MDSVFIKIDRIGGTAEVANTLRCPKQQIYALRRRADFPKPFVELASTPLWNLEDVETFRSTWKRRGHNKPVDIPEYASDLPNAY